MHRRGRRARHPRRHQEGVQEVGARAGADHAARGRQVRARLAVRVLGRPARRRLVGRQRAVRGDDRRRSSATATRWEQTYERGKATSKLKKVGPARGTGTRIIFRPDPEIFGKQQFSAETIRFRLDAKAFLHKGLTIVFTDEAAGDDGDVRARGRHRRLPDEAGHRSRQAADRAAGLLLRARRTTRASASRPRCSGPSRTRRRSARTSTASRPRRAGRTSRASAPRSSRRCARSSSTRTWRPRASR